MQPGKLSMFSYDDKILILQGKIKQEWNPQTQTINIIGYIQENDWEIQGEPYTMNNEIYFVSQKTFYRYDLIDSQISLLKTFEL